MNPINVIIKMILGLLAVFLAKDCSAATAIVEKLRLPMPSSNQGKTLFVLIIYFPDFFNFILRGLVPGKPKVTSSNHLVLGL